MQCPCDRDVHERSGGGGTRLERVGDGRGGAATGDYGLYVWKFDGEMAVRSSEGGVPHRPDPPAAQRGNPVRIYSITITICVISVTIYTQI